MNIIDAFLNFALLGSAWVLWLLVLLSVVSLAIIFERFWFLSVELKKSQDFHSNVRGFVAEKNFAGLKSFSEARRDLLDADVLLAGFDFDDKQKSRSNMEAVVASKRLRQEKGLLFLGTMGNNAPFIGLFGTVLGIIQAFHNMSIDPAGAGGAAGASVMAGISEALVATAVGLLVAIPAVLAYNFLQRLVKQRMAMVESAMKWMETR